MPRGVKQPEGETDQVFAPVAVSATRNVALFCSDEVYMQTAETDWHPLSLPENPRYIVATGSTPYYEYEGSGVVIIRHDDVTMDITLLPDVVVLDESRLSGTLEAPLTRLEYNAHTFTSNMPQWKDAQVYRRAEAGEWLPVMGTGASFEVRPGAYRLKR